MQHFKLVNCRIRGFIFWCHEQVNRGFFFKKNKLTSLYFLGFGKSVYQVGLPECLQCDSVGNFYSREQAGYFNFDWLKKVEVRRRRRSDANKVLAEMFRAAGKQIDSDKGDLKEVKPPERFVLLKPKRTTNAPFWREMIEWTLSFSLFTQASLFKKGRSSYVMALTCWFKSISVLVL